jgi:hypothetical protein
VSLLAQSQEGSENVQLMLICAKDVLFFVPLLPYTFYQNQQYKLKQQWSAEQY